MMRINNINKISTNFGNRDVLICDENMRKYLVSKGLFEIATTIENNSLKYVFLKTSQLQDIIKSYQ